MCLKALKNKKYAAQDAVFEGTGILKMSFVPSDGGAVKEFEVVENKDIDEKICAMTIFNSSKSIEGFAHACFNLALDKKWPLYFSTKNTILKKYDGLFKDIFERIFVFNFYGTLAFCVFNSLEGHFRIYFCVA